jgi:hypothetical protein
MIDEIDDNNQDHGLHLSDDALDDNAMAIATGPYVKPPPLNPDGSLKTEVDESDTMAPPEMIVKEFPKHGDLQIFRLEKHHTFLCHRCGMKKKSKLVAVQAGNWSNLLCNGCYGLLLSKKG